MGVKGLRPSLLSNQPTTHLGPGATQPCLLLLHVLQAKMGKTSKEGNDSKRKRKRVAVESSSDDDESEQDLEEVTGNDFRSQDERES